jgi:peptide/nickel transport system permease protein
MFAYALRRLFISIPLLILSSMIVYALVHLAGDPLRDLKGRNPAVPEAVLQQRRHDLYLDHPLAQQYWHWLTGIVRGDFGASVKGIDISAWSCWPCSSRSSSRWWSACCRP